MQKLKNNEARPKFTGFLLEKSVYLGKGYGVGVGDILHLEFGEHVFGIGGNLYSENCGI